MLKKIFGNKIFIAVIAIVIGMSGTFLLFSFRQQGVRLNFNPEPTINQDEPSDKGVQDAGSIKKFNSEEEFKQYLSDNAKSSNMYGGGYDRVETDSLMRNEVMPMIGIAKGIAYNESIQSSPERVSETNVQVSGIDEPDILKTDGSEIYFSSLRNYYINRGIEPMLMTEQSSVGSEDYKMIAPRNRSIGKTRLITAYPPDTMKEDSTIDQNGNMLLDDNILMIFTDGNRGISAYDVSDKSNPKKEWSIKFNDNGALVGARLMNGKVYITTRMHVDFNRPCPFIPAEANGKEITMSCSDIYYSTSASEVNTTYNFITLDTKSGKIEKKVAFVGSSNKSIFYMSANSIYLTYSMQVDMTDIAYDFFLDNDDLIPNWVIEKIEKLKKYDLSINAKRTELSFILQKYQNSLSADDRLIVKNEMNNRMEDFYIKNRRLLDKTGIAKISLEDFSVVSGSVPGHPLNQFSLDEYDGNLRIATTIGQGWFNIGNFNHRIKTISDVYVLDSNLKISGSVKGLGETERIYSVRFIKDRGYVVTFRQIDPFYVLDLSDSKNPVLRGELKIPGYSSYLHPLEKNSVLGIGKDEGKVKLSIFDVSNPNKPKEASKYMLDEYWSEAISNHHAFLLDMDNKIFFLPGSKGGYIFSFEDNKLQLKKAISGYGIKRALYLDNYLYVVSDSEVIVLDEDTWEKVNEFILE